MDWGGLPALSIYLSPILCLHERNNANPGVNPRFMRGGILWGFFCETSLSMKIARLLVDGYIWIFTRIHFFHPNFPIPVANIFIAAGCDVVAFIQFFLKSGYPGNLLDGLQPGWSYPCRNWCCCLMFLHYPMPDSRMPVNALMWAGLFCIARPGSCRAAFF